MSLEPKRFFSAEADNLPDSTSSQADHHQSNMKIVKTIKNQV
ncbi:hypothetical protein [Novosphingobium sp. CECT 9465]|nr:hypothetical protein [Novosphingobium sp. CECT 9465]